MTGWRRGGCGERDRVQAGAARPLEDVCVPAIGRIFVVCRAKGGIPPSGSESPVFGQIRRISTAWERHTARFGAFRVSRYPWNCGIRGPGSGEPVPASEPGGQARRRAVAGKFRDLPTSE